MVIINSYYKANNQNVKINIFNWEIIDIESKVVVSSGYSKDLTAILDTGQIKITKKS